MIMNLPLAQRQRQNLKSLLRRQDVPPRQRSNRAIHDRFQYYAPPARGQSSAIRRAPPSSSAPSWAALRALRLRSPLPQTRPVPGTARPSPCPPPCRSAPPALPPPPASRLLRPLDAFASKPISRRQSRPHASNGHRSAPAAGRSPNRLFQSLPSTA